MTRRNPEPGLLPFQLAELCQSLAGPKHTVVTQYVDLGKKIFQKMFGHHQDTVNFTSNKPGDIRVLTTSSIIPIKVTAGTNTTPSTGINAQSLQSFTWFIYNLKDNNIRQAHSQCN